MPVGRRPVRFNFVKRSILTTCLLAVLALFAAGPRPSGQRAWTTSVAERERPNEVKKSPVPSGKDDTAALQSWLNESAGQVALWQSFGGVPYKVEGTLNVPAESWVESTNPGSCEIEKIGNGDLFRLAGVTYMGKLYVRAATPQASGAAFDFSHFNANNCQIERVQLGNNFFNGFFIVAESGLSSFGGIRLSKILFQEPGSRVKSYGNAAFEIGSKTKRSIQIFLDDVEVLANTAADMPKAFNILNTDSLHMRGVLMVNCTTAMRVGEADTSALKTTNGYFSDVQCDGCTTGFFLENMTERHSFVNCTAEACGNGLLMLENVSGTKWSACDFGANEVNGAHFFGSVSPNKANTFTGCHFVSNGKAGGEGFGVLFDELAGGVVFGGCTFGNPEATGSKTQKVGMKIGKKSKAIIVNGCRFSKQGVGVDFENAGETENCPTTEAELKEKFGCIFA